jgi:hypothetical protein
MRPNEAKHGLRYLGNRPLREAGACRSASVALHFERQGVSRVQTNMTLEQERSLIEDQEKCDMRKQGSNWRSIFPAAASTGWNPIPN